MSLRLVLAAAGCASLLAPASALAQDYDWTGFYFGGNLGASWGDTSIKTRIERGNGAALNDALLRTTGSAALRRRRGRRATTAGGGAFWPETSG